MSDNTANYEVPDYEALYYKTPDYEAKIIETVENHFTEQTTKFDLVNDLGDTVILDGDDYTESWLRQLKTSKEMLSYYQNTPHDEITKNHFKSYDEATEEAKETIVELNDERKLLEDSLEKLSTLKLSSKRLFEHLVSSMQDKIDSVDKGIRRSESEIELYEESKEDFVVQEFVGRMSKYYQCRIEYLEGFLYAKKRMTLVNSQWHQEIIEQLQNS